MQGLAKTAEQLGFSQPQGALEQLADYVNDKINAVIGYIQSKWDQIVNFVGTVVNLITIVWNAILGPVLGAVIETVKIITNLIIEGFKTILTSFLNSPSPNNPFTDLSNEYINPQTSKNFLMNWKTFIPLDTMLNDIASDYNQVKTITNTFASLTNIVDPTKMIPDDLSIFQDLFKLISPTFVYDIFINLLVDILTKSITDILLQAISTTFQTDEAVISFFNNVIVTFGDRISNSYSDLINFSPNKGINFPVNQYSTPTILINSIFSDISDLIDSITSIIGFNLVGNLVINFGNTLFNLIFGLFYPSGTIPQTSSLLLLSCIGEFIPSILGLLGDKIWGGNEFGAYLEGKTIPQQALAITKVLGELVLDFTGICYSSATIYMLNEYNSRISGTADKIYIQKLAYLGENAPIIAFNLAGEFLEDSAKIFINQNKMYDDNNKIANRIEAVSEVVRIFANFYYVLRYSLGFLDYVTTNFNGSLPDILFSVGYLAFVIGAFQNLIGNFWGLALNYYDFSIGQYTGGDTPTLLFNNPNYWDILDVLFPIITGFTGIFGSKLAGLW